MKVKKRETQRIQGNGNNIRNDIMKNPNRLVNEFPGTEVCWGKGGEKGTSKTY